MKAIFLLSQIGILVGVIAWLGFGASKDYVLWSFAALLIVAILAALTNKEILDERRDG